MASIHNHNKQRIQSLRDALYDIEPARLQRQLGEVFAADCVIHLATPLEDLAGPAELFEQVYAPLLHAIPDLGTARFHRHGGAFARAVERRLGRLRRALYGRLQAALVGYPAHQAPRLHALSRILSLRRWRHRGDAGAVGYPLADDASPGLALCRPALRPTGLSYLGLPATMASSRRRMIQSKPPPACNWSWTC